MRRFVVVLLVVAACGGTVVAGPTTTTDSSTTKVDSSTPSLGADNSSVPETTTPLSDRPVAPDFTLELGGGGSYTLSEGTKPVYMVFWAEW